MSETELTQLEGVVHDALDALGIVHEDSYAVWAGGHQYQVDCYLPDHYAYIEADGPGIHHSRNKDDLRDVNLAVLGLRVLRLPHTYLTRTPKETILMVIRNFADEAARTAEERRKERGSDAFAGLTQQDNG